MGDRYNYNYRSSQSHSHYDQPSSDYSKSRPGYHSSSSTPNIPQGYEYSTNKAASSHWRSYSHRDDDYSTNRADSGSYQRLVKEQDYPLEQQRSNYPQSSSHNSRDYDRTMHYSYDRNSTDPSTSDYRQDASYSQSHSGSSNRGHERTESYPSQYSHSSRRSSDYKQMDKDVRYSHSYSGDNSRGYEKKQDFPKGYPEGSRSSQHKLPTDYRQSKENTSYSQSYNSGNNRYYGKTQNYSTYSQSNYDDLGRNKYYDKNEDHIPPSDNDLPENGRNYSHYRSLEGNSQQYSKDNYNRPPVPSNSEYIAQPKNQHFQKFSQEKHFLEPFKTNESLEPKPMDTLQTTPIKAFKMSPNQKGKGKNKFKRKFRKKKGKGNKGGGGGGKNNNKRPHEEVDSNNDDNEDGDGPFGSDPETAKKKVKYEASTGKEEVNDVCSQAVSLKDMPYEKQLKLKYEQGKKWILKICEDMSDANEHVKEWIEKQRELYDGLPCKIHDVIYKESDYNYYKNKVDLLIGINAVTKKRCVGLRCKGGGVAPIEPDSLTVPKIIHPLVKTFERFLEQSNFGVKTGDRVWKEVTFKLGMSTNQVLMVVGFSVFNMRDPVIDHAKQELINFYMCERNHGITSLYFMIVRMRDKNGPSHHAHYLMGKRYIEEHLDGVKFQIRPHAGFPNCLWGGELTNATVRRLGKINKDSVLIDIGSPLATVSLGLSKDCKECHYINPRFIPKATQRYQVQMDEMVKLNGITNWTQHHGSVDSNLVAVVKKNKITTATDALIYFDPWCALRVKGAAAIRDRKEVSRLLFLTCGKKLMLNVFPELVKTPKNFKRDEIYVPVEAAAIDTYPHTMHMAAFVLLEKIKVAKLRLPQAIERQRSPGPPPDDSGQDVENKGKSVDTGNPVVSETASASTEAMNVEQSAETTAPSDSGNVNGSQSTEPMKTEQAPKNTSSDRVSNTGQP